MIRFLAGERSAHPLEMSFFNMRFAHAASFRRFSVYSYLRKGFRACPRQVARGFPLCPLCPPSVELHHRLQGISIPESRISIGISILIQLHISNQKYSAKRNEINEPIHQLAFILFAANYRDIKNKCAIIMHKVLIINYINIRDWFICYYERKALLLV